MKQELEKIKAEVIAAIKKVKTSPELEELKIKYLGRQNGKLTNLLKGLKTLSIEEKKEVGQVANEVKVDLVKLFETVKAQYQESKAEVHNLDLSLPGKTEPLGHLHPLTLVRKEVEAVFKSMGFMVYEGEELTNLYYNFLALNFSETHPAMDDYDTFHIKDERPEVAFKDRLVMRAHTSNMQVRIMEKQTPPLKVIVPGRCFRNEATDACHEHTFHQCEGFVVGENISIANLIWTQKKLLSAIFKKEVKVRLRPGFFPFVEPGFELDCSCLICGGKGCPSCKHTGWVELIPCGMIHPKVFASAGYPKGKYTGFAFGMGWGRLAMMKYGINDLRLFMAGDYKFLKQF